MHTATFTRPPSPYEAVLGDAFATLDPHVQRAHLAPIVATGTLDVDHGSHALTPLLVKLLNLPDAGPAQPAQLEVSASGRRVAWVRRIGRTVLRTRQHADGSRIVEQYGAGCIEFELRVEHGALEYRQTAMSVARIPVPACIRPQLRARVSGLASGWQVAVVVTWRDHLVCRYCGVMHLA